MNSYRSFVHIYHYKDLLDHLWNRGLCSFLPVNQRESEIKWQINKEGASILTEEYLYGGRECARDDSGCVRGLQWGCEGVAESVRGMTVGV